MTKHRTLWIGHVLALACAPPEEPPVLERIEPSRGLTDRATPIAIVGAALDPSVHEDGASMTTEGWVVEISGVLLATVEWKSSTRIEALVPVGLAPGVHEVGIRSGRREARLASGFVAVSPVAPRLDAADPAHVPPEGGPVRVVGVGLHLGTTAHVRGIEVPVRWIDDQTIVLSFPPGEPGSVRLDVLTPVGRAMADDLVTYTVP